MRVSAKLASVLVVATTILIGVLAIAASGGVSLV
jgi:hypothetical protein